MSDDEFNFETEMDVRFRDIDAMGHVNNAVYATYLEQARFEYIEAVVGRPDLDFGAVLANLSMDFHLPVELGDDVTVAVRVDGLGESSIPTTQEVRVDGETAVSAEALVVTYDREAGEPVAMPDAWREQIAAFEGL